MNKVEFIAKSINSYEKDKNDGNKNDLVTASSVGNVYEKSENDGNKNDQIDIFRREL